jgi:hypothetical protein
MLQPKRKIEQDKGKPGFQPPRPADIVEQTKAMIMCPSCSAADDDKQREHTADRNISQEKQGMSPPTGYPT